MEAALGETLALQAPSSEASVGAGEGAGAGASSLGGGSARALQRLLTHAAALKKKLRGVQGEAGKRLVSDPSRGSMHWCRDDGGWGRRGGVGVGGGHSE